MSYADTEAAVIDLIKRRMPVEQPAEITPTTRFQDLGLDSLDVAQLLFEAEDCFHISFDLERASDIACIGDVASYIFRHQAKATA